MIFEDTTALGNGKVLAALLMGVLAMWQVEESAEAITHGTVAIDGTTLRLGLWFALKPMDST
eukprot:1308420-Amphidinium_carterae.2